MNAIVGLVVGIFLSIIIYEVVLATPTWFLMNDGKIVSGEPYTSKEKCEEVRVIAQERFAVASKEFWESVSRRSARSTEGTIRRYNEQEAIVRSAYCGSRRI